MADDVIADDEAVELEDVLDLLSDWWQPAPTNANTAMATENDAVLFVTARIISSRMLSDSHRTRTG
jgi:hypothetical protein